MQPQSRRTHKTSGVEILMCGFDQTVKLEDTFGELTADECEDHMIMFSDLLTKTNSRSDFCCSEIIEREWNQNDLTLQHRRASRH